MSATHYAIPGEYFTNYKVLGVKYPVENLGHVVFTAAKPLHQMMDYLDLSIVQAARASTEGIDWTEDDDIAFMSYWSGLKTWTRDAALIRYLYEHNHGGVFEHVVFSMHLKVPIFIARQWMRHRTWSYNERSLRYQEFPEEFWTPHRFKAQAKKNKQAAAGYLEDWQEKQAQAIWRTAQEASIRWYKDLLDLGVAREEARGVLTVAGYTEYYGTVDLRNLLAFVSLRDHEGAQGLMQDYARVIKAVLYQLVPYTMEVIYGRQTADNSDTTGDASVPATT